MAVSNTDSDPETPITLAISGRRTSRKLRYHSIRSAVDGNWIVNVGPAHPSGAQKLLNRNRRLESNGRMKTKSLLSLLAAASLALSSAAFAGGAKTYEVTGPVLEVNDSMIVVQKGKDRWED